MAETLQRQDPQQHGDGEPADPALKPVEGLRFIDRLRHEKVGSRLQLALEPRQLPVQCLGVHVQGAADEKLRGPADRFARQVEALVELFDDPHQPRAVHVEDGRDVRVIAPRRLAGQRQDIAHAQRVGTDQVGLNAHEIAVPGGKVDYRFYAHLLLDQDAHRQGAHPHPADRAVADVDDVGPGLPEQAGPLEILGRVQAFRRIHLHADDKRPAELLRQLSGLIDGGRDRLRAALRDRGGRPDRRRAERLDGLSDRRDVHGGGSAAPADDHRSRLHHLAGVEGHVLGGGHVQVPALQQGREPRVGLSGERRAGVRGHLLDEVEHRDRADAAVGPDDVHPGRLEGGGHLGRPVTVPGPAVLREAHLRDDREIGGRPRRADSLQQFLQIGEGLEDEHVGAALDQSVDLRPERGTGLFPRDPAVRHERFADGTDRPGDPHRLADDVPGLLGDLRAVPVDVAHAIGEAVGLEFHRVGAEGVGFDHLGARTQVIQVHVEHPLAVGQIEGIEASVIRHAALVQEGAHRPIAKERSARKAREKRMLRGRHRVSRSSGPPHVLHGCEKSR